VGSSDEYEVTSREAAPIIKWMVGKEYSYLRNYCFRKNWRFHIVSKEKGSENV